MKIIYEVLYGSRVYGTNTSDSDTDIRGILLPTIDECLSRKELKDVSKESLDAKGMKVESVYFPIHKFFKLACESNPSVLEWLFVPQTCIRVMEPAGKAIRDNRLMFLSKRLYAKFKGFAYSEFMSLTKLTGVGLNRKNQILQFGYSPKNAMNCIRLLEQGAELLLTANLTLPHPSADFLLKVKKGTLKYSEVEDRFNVLIKRLNVAKENSKLPDEPRYEDIDRLLVRILKDFQ